MNISKPVFHALANCLLLGPRTDSDYVLEEAVEHYKRFGTQWHTHERFAVPLNEPQFSDRYISDEEYDKRPAIPGLDRPPPDWRAQIQVTNTWVADEADESDESDTGWIAHFYLVANRFMFPNTTELALVFPPPLILDEARDVPGTSYHTRLYPHPSGSLGLIKVSSRELQRSTEEERGNPQAVAFERAYDVVAAVLDELAVRYDTPLPIAHSLLLGVPSGVVNVFFANRSGVATIGRNAELLPASSHSELRGAYALYREAVSSNNPFHKFLVFWRVYEEAKHVLHEWRKRHKKKDTKVEREFLPDRFRLKLRQQGDQKETSFEDARAELDGPYRNALAHAGEIRERDKALTAATAEDTLDVARKVPSVRHMARVVLVNVGATLDSTGGGSEPTSSVDMKNGSGKER
ncbi:hypothetical protein BH23ACT11_BH23ACT11_30090 [soil metagenome]